MPTLDKHEHGTFSWAELATPDPAAAKKFYGELLGWTFEDHAIGPDMVYTMCRVNGKNVSAIAGQRGDGQATRPSWLPFVSVGDVDEVATRVSANGGNVVKAPFDVMDAGRMAVVCDPTGATFALWQAKASIGAEVLHDAGALCWNELYTNNLDQAGKFYVMTIGWTSESSDMGPKGVYTLFSRPGDTENASGMMSLPPQLNGVPPHWLSYFAVEDVDAASSKATELGGKTLVPPVDIPVGRFAILRDAQGVPFGVFKRPY